MTQRYLLPLATVILAGMLPAQTPSAPPAGTPPPPPPHGRGPGGPFGPLSERRLTQQLGLTAEQQNKVHTVLEESKVLQQGMGQKESDARTRLAAAVRSGDESQIDSVSTELSQVHQQRTAAQAKAWAKIYATLTPAQKTRVDGELNRAMGLPGGPGPGPGGRGPRRGPPPGGAPPAPPTQQ